MQDTAEVLRQTMGIGVVKALGVETDTGALDGVKPKGQDPKPVKDSGEGATPAAATEATSAADSTSEPAKPSSAELDKARKALGMMGHDEDDLAALTDEQTIALGKKATARTKEIQREKREAAQARKVPANPATTDDGDDDGLEDIAREHFADFQDDGHFGKSLAGFARDVNARGAEHAKAQVEALRESFSKEITTTMETLKEAMTVEIGVRALASRFPQATTQEGRKAFNERYATLRTGKDAPDTHEAIEQTAASLWASAQLRADAERKAKIRAAKQGGHSAVASQGEPQKQEKVMDTFRNAARQHLSG